MALAHWLDHPVPLPPTTLSAHLSDLALPRLRHYAITLMWIILVLLVGP
jgi:hypothetical protein